MKTDNKLKEVIDINTKFYDITAPQFSNTRRYPWRGWKKALEFLKIFEDKKNVSVLDIGCGNGRYYEFFKSTFPGLTINYTGIDNNEYFINECTRKFPEAKFLNKCIFTQVKKFKKSNDLVVAFGITHHLPSKEVLTDWVHHVAELSKKYLIISFWNPKINNKFQKYGKDLFITDWDNKPIYRTFLKITKNDIIKLSRSIKNSDSYMYEEDKSNYLVIIKK